MTRYGYVGIGSMGAAMAKHLLSTGHPLTVYDVNEAAVARLVELGITTGYPDGTYRPNAPVTRGEMAVFLDRAFDAIASDGVLAPFEDVSIEAFYAPATDALFDAGVTLGCTADPLAYCPLAAVTRGEMASFLARILAG